jgi:hypothetical protein
VKPATDMQGTGEPMPDAAPDPSWSVERQIAHMLDLCEAQMESALAESDEAVDSLIEAFTGIVESTRELGAATGQQAEVERKLERIRQQMGGAVVAFQFYDKLTQRLGHVRYSLSTLALFVCDRSQARQRDQWRKLFMTLRRLYRTEEERQIFQLMVEGLPAEQARSQAQQTTQSLRRGAGEIELF